MLRQVKKRNPTAQPRSTLLISYLTKHQVKKYQQKKQEDLLILQRKVINMHMMMTRGRSK